MVVNNYDVLNLYKCIHIYLYAKVLNFDSPRGGISLETQKTRTGTSSKVSAKSWKCILANIIECQSNKYIHFIILRSLKQE